MRQEDRMRTMWIGMGLALALGLPGCNPGSGKGTVMAADLSKLGFAIASYEDGLKKAPSAAADLKPFMEATSQEREAY